MLESYRLIFIPTHCPECQAPISTQFDDVLLGSVRSCKENIAQSCSIFCFERGLLTAIFLTPSSFNNIKSIYWSISSSHLSYYRTKDDVVYRLPYFDPDLSDYPKLMDKIRTLLTFQ
jgi:hypothetical protein